jgi:peptidoglycan/xylan/chitin deacetylase (PgdA/CDA1 family)
MERLNNQRKIGVAAFICAVGLAQVDLRLTLIPTFLFILLCLVAPFLPRFSFYLPIISSGHTGRQVVALTFDDGPDPATTPPLLRLLGVQGVPATFFVIGRRAAAYPDLIRAILDAGHSIGNHSFNHDPFVGFKGQERIAEEVLMTQRVLDDLGVTPLVFRPPMGVTYPGLGKVLRELGLGTVTFSCRAFDRGNRSIGHLAERILGKARGDDIIMLHDLPPVHPASIPGWLAEVEALLSGITRRGLEIRPLSELIGRPVDRMPQHQPGIQAVGPVGSFASTRDRKPGGRP